VPNKPNNKSASKLLHPTVLQNENRSLADEELTMDVAAAIEEMAGALDGEEDSC
jgi:hypothetical protein